MATGKERARFAGHTNDISGVAFSPDGRYLASGSFDRTVRVWDVSARRLVCVCRGHRDEVFSVACIRRVANVPALAFSPDGTRLASCADDWRVGDGTPEDGNTNGTNGNGKTAR